MSEQPTIYLSGSMDGLTKEEATGWRNYVKVHYPHYNFRDPCRRPAIDFRDYNDTDIELDLIDISHSDVVLVNLTQYSPGTLSEIVHARYMHKMTLLVNSTGQNVSPWIRYHVTEMFDSIDDAMKYIENFYFALVIDQIDAGTA